MFAASRYRSFMGELLPLSRAQSIVLGFQLHDQASRGWRDRRFSKNQFRQIGFPCGAYKKLNPPQINAAGLFILNLESYKCFEQIIMSR